MPMDHSPARPQASRGAINVIEMLDMLTEIHEEARGDRALRPFARSIGTAIRILTELRRAAQAVLIEAEADVMGSGRAR